MQGTWEAGCVPEIPEADDCFADFPEMCMCFSGEAVQFFAWAVESHVAAMDTRAPSGGCHHGTDCLRFRIPTSNGHR